MTILIVGSSHINSLILARIHGSEIFNEKLEFIHASIEAWRISKTCVIDNHLQFINDPLDVLCNLESVHDVREDENNEFWIKNKEQATPIRIPNNIRQLAKADFKEPNDISTVVFIGLFPNPVSDIYFDDYDFCEEYSNPNRYLLSKGMALQIEHPVTGNYSSQAVFNSITEYLGITTLRNRLQSNFLMEQLSSAFPNAQPFLIGFHPPFSSSMIDETEFEIQTRIRRRKNFIALWEHICQSRGWRFLPPPDETLDDDGLFIKNEYSIAPERGDPHLNKNYGELLWDKVFNAARKH